MASSAPTPSIASEVAAPKNTGGGGFVFEDDVCAWLMASMLVGEPVFGADVGAPIRLDFQARVDGWFLDDALVTTHADSQLHRLAVSIKSNAQFTASRAPADFVGCAWEQWLHVGTAAFDRSLDFMVLMTAPLSSAATTSVSGLVEKARAADPELLPTRLKEPNWASQEERGLFSSFRCPSTLGVTHSVTEADAVRLLQRLQFRQHDFGAVASGSLNEALRICRSALRSKSQTDAQLLWNALRGVSAELRPRSGSLTRGALVDRIRKTFLLAAHPDHLADWATLSAHSKLAATQVPNLIAGRIQLRRDDILKEVRGAVLANDSVTLVGASGIGKSALARSFFESRTTLGEKTLWFDARSFESTDFDAFQANLRLRYSLAELVGATPEPEPVLILDGLDRMYRDAAFQVAAILLRLVRQEAPATRWRVALTCQSHEWPRVLEAIERAGFFDSSWKEFPVPKISEHDLSPVCSEFPQLAKLTLSRVASLMGNLKILDLIARRTSAGVVVDASAWVGESNVADWFWAAEVDRGPDRVARGRFLRCLAQRQADTLLTSIPADDFEAAELRSLESLAADQICLQVDGDRIAFAHDLFGDWARLRVLLNHRGDLSVFLGACSESPMWHRAIRLFGVHLLESGEVDQWRIALKSVGSKDIGVAHDLLLEAPIFAVNSTHLLEAILPDLLANEGFLLQRLLTRFLAFATLPDLLGIALAKAAGIKEDVARLTYRTPNRPYWTDLLRLLHKNRVLVLPVAPREIARVVELWLGDAPEQRGELCREAAEIAVMLGRLARETRERRGDREWQRDRQRFYACAFRAARYYPDEVSGVALAAAERAPSPEPDLLPISPNTRPRKTRGRWPETQLPPWPDGPHSPVEEEFRSVVLDTNAVLELFRVRPEISREIILATLIDLPHGENWYQAGREDSGIFDQHQWLPAFYTHGPFLACLGVNFREGLELIARLVDFATDRWNHTARLKELARAEQVDSQEVEAPDVNELFRPDPPGSIPMKIGTATRIFQGGRRVYSWGGGAGTPPEAVASALMALEQYFHFQLDAKRDIASDLATVLARAESVAFLKVLCEIGKRSQLLFEGPLRPLLAVPEIYEWENYAMFQGRGHLLMNAGRHGQRFVDLAKQFHEAEHRRRDLQEIARQLMLTKRAMSEFFTATLAEWAQRLEGGEAGSIPKIAEQLMVSLDPANYQTLAHPDFGTGWVNTKALSLQAKHSDERRAFDDHVLLSAFPSRCRTIIDENKVLSSSELESIWKQLQHLAKLDKREDRPIEYEKRYWGDEFANAISGGVAVLIRQGQWRDEWPDREEWAKQALMAILANPPAGGALDTPACLSKWTWDCFASEVISVLWVQRPLDPQLRRAAARLVLAPHYAAVQILFERCAAHRLTLGSDFTRLRHLALEWAHVRNRKEMLRAMPAESLGLEPAELAKLAQLTQNLDSWCVDRIEAFVEATNPETLGSWSSIEDRSRFVEIDAILALWNPGRALDLRIVRAAHTWLPLPQDALSGPEQNECLLFWGEALSAVLAPPHIDPDLGRHYPCEEERWVLASVAAILQHLKTEERPDELWQRVMDLPEDAHTWPEVFAQAVHAHALKCPTLPAGYVEVVRSIVSYTLPRNNGRPRWPYHDTVWDSLIGIDGYSRAYWQPRHVDIAVQIGNSIKKWIELVPMHGRRIAALASWLSGTAASRIRVPAFLWLEARLVLENWQSDRRAKEASDHLASLLGVIWRENAEELRANSPGFAVFNALLKCLCDKQNAIALELVGRMGSLT